MNILYVANSLPYDKIHHGGGQTFNFYIKKICQYENIKVVGFCKQEELSLLDYKKYGFECYPIITKGNIITNLKRVLFDIYGRITHLSDEESYYKIRKIKQKLLKLKRNGYEPDIIVLEWTNIVNLIDSIKKIFLTAKYVASEHDVAFLGEYRKYMQGNKSEDAYNIYVKRKNKELESLRKCDMIMPHNYKDKQLLIDNGIQKEKIFVLTPYYNNMNYINRKKHNKDILFFGAMYRKENYEAALWFIDKVMPYLEKYNLRFVVLGNKPPKILKNKECKNVIITGFVENITQYFEESLCMVSPLITGAGIKIKILEALSSGIPVLTNEIGIEGIPAKDGESYFHCISPEDYIKVILNLLNDNYEDYSLLQKNIIKNNFDLDSGFLNYHNMLKKIKDN